MSTRMFLYYALHSLKNQIRKLLKTWVLIFILICMVGGGLIGLLAGYAADSMDDDSEASEASDAYTEDATIPDTEDPGILFSLQDEDGLLSEITRVDMLELVSGGVILLFLFFYMISADKSGAKIFQMADVNLLFTSPMSPSSVLMFRVLTQMGLMLFITLYMVFQLPNLILNLGLSGWMSVVILFAWFFLLLYCTLIQTLLYLTASVFPLLKKYLHLILYAVIFLIAGAYMICARGTGNYLLSAFRFFNAPASRWIPVWGWTKGLLMFAVDGQYLKAGICLALILLSDTALIYAIRHVPADYYEDAMAKSEETAELQSRARESKTGIAAGKKKDRPERIMRDGFRQGAGADVFFFKALYNRFRFAHLHFFTKTMETYLAASIGTALLLRFVLDISGNQAVTIILLELAGMSFFRALGNSLEEDTGISWFVLIPESTVKKLLWSLLGCITNCVLDLVLPVILGTFIAGGDSGYALLWSVLALSLFSYATVIGLFIGVSVPEHAGKTVKQFVQILFVYFGMIPDAVILVFGMLRDATMLAGVLAVVVNLLFSALFFALCPGYLSPHNGGKTSVRNFYGNLKQIKKTFSYTACSIAVVFLISYAVANLAAVLLARFYPAALETEAVTWCLSFAPTYLIAVPVGLAMLLKTPKTTPDAHPLGPGTIISAFFILIFLMYSGNLLGNLINLLLGSLIGISVNNNLLNYALSDNLFLKILVMVILAPVIEEWIFRKQLIDRTLKYGEKPAILCSALLFGLFHGNLYQFFYAFLIGLLFGYLYVRSGKLRYSVGLHMLVNFMGSVIAGALQANIDLTVLDEQNLMNVLETGIPTGIMLYGLYLLLLLACWIVGLVLLIIRARRLTFRETAEELPQGSILKTVILTPGMLFMLVMFILGTVISMIV